MQIKKSTLIQSKIEILENKIILDIPLRTVSEANCFAPWREKYKRHRIQQSTIAKFLNPLKEKIKLPCQIMLTRFAPRELDEFENLPMSFKYIVDAICAILTQDYRPGHADRDKRINLKCTQVISKDYGIRIEIMF